MEEDKQQESKKKEKVIEGKLIKRERRESKLVLRKRIRELEKEVKAYRKSQCARIIDKIRKK
jgi:hypothetical protein